MTSNEFCYWLQGYFEMTESPTLSPNQIEMIKNHLALVFEKVTPTLLAPEELTTQPFFINPTIPHPNDVICAPDTTAAPHTRPHVRTPSPTRYC